MDTEFWGVEVKTGEPVKVQPDSGSVIHISQAALGESKKGNETFPLFVRVGEQKLVLGTLSTENIPQLSFDLMFEKEFELSHNWKNGSVFFLGYQTRLPDEEDFDSEDEEMDLPLENVQTVKPATINPKNAKTEKPKVTLVEPSKDDETDEDDSDEDDESDDDDESEEGMSVDGEDSDDDESDSEDEETPKVESGKKRLNDSAAKTPVPSKKAKVPQKTDDKKAGQVTPHPAKNAGKATANSSSVKSQKSGGQFSCKSCDRSFGSDGALKSHSQAKHGGK